MERASRAVVISLVVRRMGSSSSVVCQTRYYPKARLMPGVKSAANKGVMRPREKRTPLTVSANEDGGRSRPQALSAPAQPRLPRLGDAEAVEDPEGVVIEEAAEILAADIKGRDRRQDHRSGV